MKVFISWSGRRSQAVAELLSEWVKCVLQATTPWISSRDIDRGSLWFSEISDQLQDIKVGIICVTQENKERPWILFEAGALAKGLSSNRVCTLLIDLDPSDVQDPLAQFNHTRPIRSDMMNLIGTLNRALDNSRLEQKVLEQVFDTYWPQFEEKFQDALTLYPANEVTPPRPKEDMIEEILNNTRDLAKRVRQIETNSITSFNRFSLNELKRNEVQAFNWMQHGKLVTSAKGRKFIIKAQDVPPSPVEAEIESLIQEQYGDDVAVVYHAVGN